MSPETIAQFEQGGAGHDRFSAPKPVETAPPEKDEPTKRLSIDIPHSAHTRFKTACSATGNKMATELLQLIERRTAELEKKAGLTHK